MGSMSVFVETDHPRGRAGNAGQFRDKPNSAPEAGLASGPSATAFLDEVAERLHDDPWARDPDRLARIALSVLVEPGDDAVAAALWSLGPRAALERAAVSGKITGTADPANAVVAAIINARHHGIGLMTIDDSGWPEQFGDLAPYALWTKGDVALLGGAEGMTSVTGSRAATGYGDHVAAELAGSLSEAGQTVVTGASYGIDGMAVRAVLNTRGKTIAVLAGGLDSYYPAGHEVLIRRVGELGLLISDTAPGARPNRARLASRGRLIAALSARTVVVEAGMLSGSLKIASEAKRLNRDVCAVPGPVTSPVSTGTNWMIANGTARLVTDAQDVVGGPRA